MAIGAGSTLGAAALFYESLQLLGFTVIFVVVIHLFVVFYEEPVLKRTFGEEYGAPLVAWPSDMSALVQPCAGGLPGALSSQQLEGARGDSNVHSLAACTLRCGRLRR
jgi:hypothetical protein